MYLITRPEEDALPLVLALANQGIESIISPVMSIGIDETQQDALSDSLAGEPALLFTSVNGVRAFTALSTDRELDAFAVGEATGRACRDSGFRETYIAGGDVDKLAARVELERTVNDGPLLHVSGKTVAGDLSGRLSAAGFDVNRLPLYEAKAASAFTQETEAALKDRKIKGVLFFSPRTARIFIQLLKDHKLIDKVKDVAAHCLSPAVAIEVSDVPFGSVQVAVFPTRDDLLQTVWDAQ